MEMIRHTRGVETKDLRFSRYAPRKLIHRDPPKPVIEQEASAPEADDQTAPDTYTFKTQRKTEDVGTGDTDNPVAETCKEHRDARVLHPAKQAQRNHLGTVNKLEERGHAKKTNPDRKDLDPLRLLRLHEKHD